MDRAPLVLASASPRRRALLEQIGVPHRVQPVDVDETPRPGEAPEVLALRLALAKARAGAALAGGAPVLGADTVVVLDGRCLGKPAGRAEAVETLCRLGGREHEVVTAVALCEGGREASRLSVSRVRMRPITRAEAEAYWETGEPRDKAGGYAIQGLGAVFVAELRGSYSGVMGLPLHETAELLAAFGVPVWQRRDAGAGAGGGPCGSPRQGGRRQA